MSNAKRLKRAYANIAEDKARNLDALDPRRIAQALPPQEAEYRAAEHLYNICDDVKRRGAGGTKSGLVGIRPSGQGAAQEFEETFMKPPEKEADPERIDLSKEGGGEHKGPRFRAIRFPANVCIICMRQDVGPPAAGCKKKNCTCCPMLDLTPIMQEMKGLKRGDVIRSTICGTCKHEIRKERRGGDTSIYIPEDIRVRNQVDRDARRIAKMLGNIEYILNASRLERITEDGVAAEGIGGA